MRDRPLPRTLYAGAAIVGLLGLTALAAPLLAPHDPVAFLDPAAGSLQPPGASFTALHLKNGGWRLAEAVHRRNGRIEIERLGRIEVLDPAEIQAPAAGGIGIPYRFPLGSDRFGRDVASRLLFGSRVSFGVGVGAAAISLLLGLLIGGAAALGGPWIDGLLMRSADALFAVPTLFLIVAFATLIPPGLTSTLALFGLTSWMEIARTGRAEILSLKSRDFIIAARTIGLGPFAIFFRHILPNTWTPLLVQATNLIGNIILAESSLSFIGLGIQPPIPSWGNMISEGRDVLTQGWWTAVFPGAALALTVVGFNLIADGVRDLFDPRASHSPRS